MGGLPDDLACALGYRPFAAYAQSKLAVLLFSQALQRRFAAATVVAPTGALFTRGSSR